MLQEATPFNFKQFFRLLAQLQVSRNYVLTVHGAENLFLQSDLENFIYILRVVDIPKWLKIVLSIERRTTNFSKLDKLIKVA